VFGYAIEDSTTGTLLGTAETALICLDRNHQLSRLPPAVVTALVRSEDPVRL
jgi:acyl-CoA thioesterase FadM